MALLHGGALWLCYLVLEAMDKLCLYSCATLIIRSVTLRDVRAKLGSFVVTGLLTCLCNNEQVKLGRRDASWSLWESIFLNVDGVLCSAALESYVEQTPDSLKIQWTLRQKKLHIICHSGNVLAVNEYKDLFITPSAHITDRLNHSLAVKMTVAQ